MYDGCILLYIINIAEDVADLNSMSAPAAAIHGRKESGATMNCRKGEFAL